MGHRECPASPDGRRHAPRYHPKRAEAKRQICRGVQSDRPGVRRGAPVPPRRDRSEGPWV